MTTFEFVDAVKEQEKGRIALDGPSGSGKTWTALCLAQGLGQRIALIDTERRSALKYADIFAFKHLSMHTFDPRDLVKAIAAAADGGYDVLIIDSLSHFWMGIDGMLEQVDRFAKRNAGGNQFGGWKDARPLEREMIDAILAYPGHVIVTMRTKSEWVISEDERGRKVPKKIGLKAEQRDGIEYEFDIVGDLDLEHNLIVSKSRMATLADRLVAKPDAELGAEILVWLSDGTKVPTVQDYLGRTAMAETFDQVREIFEEVQARGMGAAPCTIEGRAMTLRQYIIGRGHMLKPQQPAQQQPPVAAPQDDDSRLKDLRTKLVVLVGKKLGITDRDQRLAAVAGYLGKRPISSFNELSFTELSNAIANLTRRPDHVPRSNGRYDELHAKLVKAGIDDIDPVMHAATDARDAGEITEEQWQSLSDAADARADALLAHQRAEQPIGAAA